MSQGEIVTQAINYWIKGLGDAYILSWPNTVLYGCSFVVAIFKWRELKRTQAPLAEQYFWCFMVLLLFFLGINKQLNFQNLLIDMGRRIAQHGGWFEKRRLVQEWFAYALFGVVGCCALVLVISIRKLWRRNVLAITGLGVLCAYTLLRAALLSHVVGRVAYLSSRGRFRATDVIELVGILCVLANALKRSGDR
jgi:hypothetical protein